MSEPLSLVLAPDPGAFAAAARPFTGDPAALDALVPDLLRETALRHHREEYPKHVPHALLALLGGLESADLLEGADRVRPILQALSYVSKEKHFDPLPVAASPVPEQMLADGLADCFNLCHRFIYTAKVMQRLSRTPGLDADALLTPVRHYHTLAPEDGRFADALAGYGDEAHLAAAGEAASKAREGGASAITMLDDVFARAVRRLADVEGLGTVGWVGMAHVATFSEAARWWYLTSEAEERRVAPWVAELFLADSLKLHGLGGEETAGPADGDPDRLLAAIRSRDPETARAEAAALAARPADHPALHRALLLGCSEIDGHLAFSHDVKVTAAAVRLHRESREPGIAGCLADVAAFLARLPAGAELADALFPQA
jgi:hypothetical protein